MSHPGGHAQVSLQQPLNASGADPSLHLAGDPGGVGGPGPGVGGVGPGADEQPLHVHLMTRLILL